MRTTLILIIALTSDATLCAQEENKDPLKEQKKRAEDNWKMLDAGPLAHLETENLLIYAPMDLKEKLASIGKFYEKCYSGASKLLFTEEGDQWKGKLTIYLFSKSTQYGTFVRRIEGRRVEGIESATTSVEDDKLHIAAGPPRDSDGPRVEVRAAQLIGSAVIQRKAGSRSTLPNWLRRGFGIATYQRALGGKHPTVKNARREAAVYVLRGRKTAKDVWMGTLSEKEEEALEPSLADYLSYGPGRKQINNLVKAAGRTGVGTRNTFETALTSVKLTAESVESGWRRWVRSPK